MTIKYTRSARLEAVSSLQLKHRWYTDVRCQQESVGFAASSGEMSLFPALHGHSPCARLWRVGSARLLGGTQSSVWMSHATRLFFSPGRALGEKKSLTEWETAGCRPVSQRPFISPVVKFISRLQIFCFVSWQGEQHKVTPPGSRLHASLSSSALLSKEPMIAVIIDDDDSFLISTLHFNEFIFPLHCFWIIY